MKILTCLHAFSFYRTTLISILLFSSLFTTANSYSNGVITIDENFTSGNLGNIIESLHSNLAEIKYLTIRTGTLDNEDVYWIRDNLDELYTLNIYDEGKLTNNSLPDNALLRHKNIRNCFCENVTSVGNNAFKECSNLYDARFVQLNSIGDSAFAECTYFWKLRINSSTPPDIGEGTFENCPYYRQLRLPFEGKIACRAVDDGNTNDNYWYGFELVVPFESKVTIEQNFSEGELHSYVSSLRSKLTEITELIITKGTLNTQDIYWIRDSLPNLKSLTINEDAAFSDGGLPDNAFKNHSNLQYANISTAAFIGNNAFENCSGLVTVYAYTATSLGDYALKNCYRCNQLCLNKNTPPSVGEGTFDGCTADGKVVDLNGASNSNAYKAVDDGNTTDNFWYGWEINLGGSSAIQVKLDTGGYLDWGKPAAWDSIYENEYGAMFWNGEDWIVNESYAHMYFEDLRTRMRVGNYSGIDYRIPTETTYETGRIIGGYFISTVEYNYTVDATDGGSYTYTGLKYSIFQPDGTTIELYSRGNGNGTDSSYFDIVLEDTSPGPGITTFREGGVVSDATEFTLEEAINNPIVDSLILGRLVTSDTINFNNTYFVDTNGGYEMGGMSYVLKSTLIPLSKTAQAYEQCQIFTTQFSTHFTNDDGELESFFMVPLLKSESYTPPNATATEEVKIDNELTIYPNPATNILHIKNTDNFRPEALFIYDTNGRLRIAQNNFSDSNINVSELTPGIYFLVLQNRKETYTERFVKK